MCFYMQHKIILVHINREVTVYHFRVPSRPSWQVLPTWELFYSEYIYINIFIIKIMNIHIYVYFLSRFFFFFLENKHRLASFTHERPHWCGELQDCLQLKLFISLWTLLWAQDGNLVINFTCLNVLNNFNMYF